MIRRLWTDRAGSATRRLLAAAAAALCLAVPVRAASPSTNPSGLSLAVSFQGVMTITDLKASSGTTGGQITLQWTAPVYNGGAPPLGYEVRVSTSGNISTVGEFNAAQPLSVFSPDTPPAVLPGGSSQGFTVTGLVPDVIYCFAIRAADSNVPQAVGGWLRSVPRNLNVFNCAPAANVLPPQAPFGITISTTATTATVGWMPVHRYRNTVAFVDPANPFPFELSDYRVYRATAPVRAPWTEVAVVSTATWAFTDLGSGPQYYYHVKALNTNGASYKSMVRAHNGEGWIIGYDDLSTMMIPKELVEPLLGVAGNPGDPDTAYLIDTTSHTSQLGGLVLKSLELRVRKGGTQAMSTMRLEQPGVLRLHYEQTASSVTVSGAGLSGAAPAGVGNPQPEELSVFWWNGSKWVQLYGKLSGLDQTMLLETPFFGQYQLRQGERLGQFTFNGAGISNRFITPNGDGKNDEVVFFFDNPQGSQISVKIYDIKGKLVQTVTRPGPLPNNTVVWDAMANGQPVPGGVYIYQIGAEGESFTGTIVVIK